MAAGLTADRIQELLLKTRQKGLYVAKLNEFLTMDEVGINVNETWPEFAPKPAATLKQGFDNAKQNKDAAEGSDSVKVVVDGEEDNKQVYLINLSKAQELAEAQV
jgi:hypothetical protein